MAPVLSISGISDLSLSSLELDSRSSTPVNLASYLASLSLSEREALGNTPRYSKNAKRSEEVVSLLAPRAILSPVETFQTLTARSTTQTTGTNPGAGSVNPNDINMKGLQALFALIGASFVLGAIWFFFWAKNGGFQWRKGDWEDYKSTVLRRKGPNGTTLSNATKSTRLGGGSVVGDGYSDDNGSTVGGQTMTELSSEAPIIKEKARQSRKKSGPRETAKDRKVREVKQAEWEGGHDDDVRAYRHEKVAKVGGLNKESDAQVYGTDYSATERSDVHSNSQRSSSNYTYPSQNQRRSSRQASPEKRQSRRDFSYTQDTARSAASQAPAHAQPQAPPQGPRPSRYHSPSKQQPRSNRAGTFTEPSDWSDLQSQHTKSYHHPIPGLSGGQQQTRGSNGGGFRRGQGDELDD